MIAQPAEKLIGSAEEGLLVALVDAAATELREAGNWHARKRIMLAMLADLESRVLARAEADDGDRTFADSLRSRLNWIDWVHFFIGGILERLDERAIKSTEQAAFYLLSAHAEHEDAAVDWLEADRRRRKDLRRLIKTNRAYADLFFRTATATGIASLLDVLESADEPEELAPAVTSVSALATATA
jgi:hypothetical protein